MRLHEYLNQYGKDMRGYKAIGTCQEHVLADVERHSHHKSRTLQVLPYRTDPFIQQYLRICPEGRQNSSVTSTFSGTRQVCQEYM